MVDMPLQRTHPIRLHLPIGEIIGARLMLWQQRRTDRLAMLRMQRLDEKLLRDIGLTPDDVRRATGLPLSTNAAAELERTRRSRIGSW